MKHSMTTQWQRIEDALSTLGCLTEMALQPGAQPERIAELERHLGVTLPDSLKAFLAVHDGQDGNHGLVGGEHLLSVDGIRNEWSNWREIDESDMNADSAQFMTSEPPGYIKPLYTHRSWIPLTKDWGGNHYGLDFDPDEKGRVGQVIKFGRDEDEKRLIAEDFDRFVELVVASLAGATWDGEQLHSEL
ncbi:SMI1/KNR4 family protein [Roseateles chitinivorans]|uniref:SMI1/KNR4 family protein n=1 Tax=Roseateles chitinivorans TaxID=2917965 RepID=UPI003D67F980